MGASTMITINAPAIAGLTDEVIWEGSAPTAATVPRRRSSATPIT